MRRAHKYGAVATWVDGMRFASGKEAARYSELKLMERAGVISNLELQPRFPMVLNGALVTTYVADFGYDESGGHVIEDVKGVQTPEFKIKAKLMAAIYNITVRIT